jgi:putative ABC transport system ATP-binding protein
VSIILIEPPFDQSRRPERIPPPPVLELTGIVKEYGGDPPVRALDGVDVTIAAGDLVAVVGPSGSGKTTLLHVMGALDQPTEGTVSIEGTPFRALSDLELAGLRAYRIGFVFQQYLLIEGLDAVDNVATGLLYRGIGPGERRARAVQALERVGLGHRLGHAPHQMSGGEKQRVAIARALVGDPAVVLADEPTGNLDSHTSDEIVGLLRELNDAGTTIVVITHDRELAVRLPRRVAIRDGRIEADETTAA